ncbi:MAG: SpoIIE family protein phosphatase [Helicobacteraceae bacterium]|nr:SpoIIE family protein phosphatase [Helicobacteraceae bacterium]
MKNKILGALLIIFVVGLLYNLYNANTKITRSFEATKELNNLMLSNKDLNFMMSSLKPMNNDHIKTLVKRMQATIDRLSLEIKNREILDQLKALDILFSKKIALAEEFKSTNAVLNNSHKNIFKLFIFVENIVEKEDYKQLVHNFIIPMQHTSYTNKFFSKKDIEYLDNLLEKNNSSNMTLELFVAHLKVLNTYLINFPNLLEENKKLNFEKKTERLIELQTFHSKKNIASIKIEIIVFLVLLIVLMIFIYTLSNSLDKEIVTTKEQKKDLQILSDGLEVTVKEKTKDIKDQQLFTQALLDSQEQIVITTNGNKIVSANETFFDFYAVNTIAEFLQEYKSECICVTFNTKAPTDYLQAKVDGREWIDYVINNFGVIHKVMITRGKKDFIFSVTGARLPGSEGVKSAIFTDITEMENSQLELTEVHKHTKESISYAALIQSSLIPTNKLFRNYFSDYFAIWHPKDIVGGDIYLFEELRDKDECLTLVIDCTGHGVPGAFLTMLIKAIERQVTNKIITDPSIDVSPAWILSYFNRSIKKLLKQDDKFSYSNVGFDGQVMYYNKKENIIKVASAKSDIFYYQNSELSVIKGDRHSVGYRDSDINFEFTDHIIDTSTETTIYLSTDGYVDQNGGTKELPFGKKRLKKMLEKCYSETLADQQEMFIYTLEDYKDGFEQNDDITVVALRTK